MTKMPLTDPSTIDPATLKRQPAPQGPRTTLTMHALHQRINRKLRREDEVLRTARGQRCRSDLGDYCTLNRRFNWIIAQHVDPEVLGRDIGVLKDWECVSDLRASRHIASTGTAVAQWSRPGRGYAASVTDRRLPPGVPA